MNQPHVLLMRELICRGRTSTALPPDRIRGRDVFLAIWRQALKDLPTPFEELRDQPELNRRVLIAPLPASLLSFTPTSRGL